MVIINCRIVDLRHKEVVNSKDGVILGYVDDVEVDVQTAKLVSIVVYGKLKCFGLLGKCDDIVICWDKIELIGEDAILVDYKCNVQKKRKCKFPFINIKY